MASIGTEDPISEIARQHLRLQLTEGIGPILANRLLTRFGTVERIMSSSIAELSHVEGIGPRIAESITRSRQNDAVQREVDLAGECGVRILCTADPDYPAALKQIPDPPICLYVRGQLVATDAVAIAIVGTRRCSTYGREQAVRFGEMLGGAGFTVVSGMARGVDGHAHRGAIQSGGRTIAVLGSGLRNIYPPEHRDLADEIAAAGAVVTEVPLESQPSAENFPRRNRIITGLALGVLVIEAGARSGALITARLASEYNREVFALPGRVDRPDQTAGVHRLIREGQAKLVTCLDDVLDELGDVGAIMGSGTISTNDDEGVGKLSPLDHALTEGERAVLAVLTDEPRDVDAIVRQTGLDLSRVMSSLTALQLKALVTQFAGQRYVRGRAP